VLHIYILRFTLRRLREAMKYKSPTLWLVLGAVLVVAAVALWLWPLLVPIQNPASLHSDTAECGSLRDVQGYSKQPIPDDQNAPPWSGFTDSGLVVNAPLKRECLAAAATAQAVVGITGLAGAGSLALGIVILVRKRQSESDKVGSR
jgi:hypothetical protein